MYLPVLPLYFKRERERETGNICWGSMTVCVCIKEAKKEKWFPQASLSLFRGCLPSKSCPPPPPIQRRIPFPLPTTKNTMDRSAKRRFSRHFLLSLSRDVVYIQFINKIIIFFKLVQLLKTKKLFCNIHTIYKTSNETIKS